MADELKDQRVVTMMSPSELEEIDEWMFDHRIRSRGEAIRRLCRIGALWDAVSSDLFNELESAVDGIKTHQSAAVEVLGKPSDPVQPWVSKYVIASLKASIVTMEHLSNVSEIARRAATPADVMKIKGSFPVVHAASLAIEQEILTEALSRFEHAKKD